MNAYDVNNDDYFEDDVTHDRQWEVAQEVLGDYASPDFVVESALNDTLVYSLGLDDVGPNGEHYDYLICGRKYRNSNSDTLYVHLTNNKDVYDSWYEAYQEQQEEYED